MGAPFVIICMVFPAIALRGMHKAKADGGMHSPAVKASYGWLCAHYKENCYRWEILTLLGRVFTMAALLMSPAYALAVYLVVTTTILAMQLCFKPFLETEEEAAPWSSPNKQAGLSYAASITFFIVGLVLHVSEADGDGAAAGLLSVVAILAVLALTAMTVAVWKHSTPFHATHRSSSKVDTSASVRVWIEAYERCAQR